MPKTNIPAKPVHSFRLSREAVRQLKELASQAGRSESDVVEIALDRMYREERRLGAWIREGAENNYQTNEKGEEQT
jgi:predicted transcriptional regulator